MSSLYVASVAIAVLVILIGWLATMLPEKHHEPVAKRETAQMKVIHDIAVRRSANHK